MRNLILAAFGGVFAVACGVRPEPREAAVIPQPRAFVEGGDFVRIGPEDLRTAVDTAVVSDPEGYRLTVGPDGAEVVGGGEAGVFYGLQTLEQLKDSAGWVPTGVVNDAPRFRWRGMHLDVSRHFFPKEFIKKYLDILAYHRMNVFHWHLTDGIGWRLESDRYPLLTQRAAWRRVKDPKAPWIGLELSDELRRDSADTYGGYYTKEDVREIVAYARERHITVIPEIECRAIPRRRRSPIRSTPARRHSPGAASTVRGTTRRSCSCNS